MIATLEEVKEYLRISDTSEDNRLTLLLNAADAFVKQYAGRQFEYGTYTETVKFTNGVGFVKETPLESVSSVMIEDTAMEIYQIDSQIGFIQLYARINAWGDVTYTGGETPDDVKLALLRLVEFWYTHPEGVVKQGLEGINYSFSAPNEVLRILELYRRKLA